MTRTASTNAVSDAPPTPTLTEALRFWAKLGCISFGGPAGQIAIMHRELVEQRRWISERRFLHALNYCMLLPGPEAQQLATYLGWLLHRNLGGVLAGVLFVLPSLLLLICLSWLYIAFGDQPVIAGLLYGIKPAVVAIVVHAAARVGGRVLHNPLLWLIALAAFVGIVGFALPFPAIVAGAALCGAMGVRVRPTWFAHHSSHSAAPAATTRSAVVDDDSPMPAHTRFRLSRLIAVLAIAAMLWLVPMLLLWQLLGSDHIYTQMAWFFTKAALLTFGGAYAVLPYVSHAAVTTYGWLTPTQIVDGLALGESTPGPLIMVVAFVAFVGAFVHAPLAAQAPFLAGALAACLVTWFTFLPSFVFILAGAPLIEAGRSTRWLHAPLAAITAAVVGVIASLALFFGYHVLWPTGLSGPIDGAAVVLASAAGLALFVWRRGVIDVLVSCAVLGLIWRLVHG